MSVDMRLPKIDENCDVLPINGHHGLCRSYYQPDELDIKTIEYAKIIKIQNKEKLSALDLGCSPYFPQSQRLAKLGFEVDAFDLEKPNANFDDINQQFSNRIHYHVKNIAQLQISDLKDDYSIVYSNRCLSFLSYPQTQHVLRLIINKSKQNTRFFLSFFAESAMYAENYPIHLPLENRYVPLNNQVAQGNAMLAPVCVYRRDEIFEKLLYGLPITVIEEIKAQSGSIKIIFKIL